jgi:predicted NodU family carbamoyl transferase
MAHRHRASVAAKAERAALGNSCGHVDCPVCVRTVHRETNPRYYALLTRLKALTGCPVPEARQNVLRVGEIEGDDSRRW